jgi:hypothetical protein
VPTASAMIAPNGARAFRRLYMFSDQWPIRGLDDRVKGIVF